MAFPRPTILGTFSVPDLFCLSCPPPSRRGSRNNSSLTNRAPIPLGALNLWPDIDRRSKSRSTTSILIFPIAWTASLWKIIFLSKSFSFFLTISINSFIFWIDPISLLANIIDINLVLSLINFSNSFIFINPFSSTLQYLILLD